MRKYFGTDGVRGVANDTLTPELAFKLGKIGGLVIAGKERSPKFVVGRDTRISGEMLESALISGLMSTGVDVIQLGVIPTPGVAYLTKHLEADGGVMISASHNPFEDNGIKFFNKTGFKLTDEQELEIENLLGSDSPIPLPTGEYIGKIIKGSTLKQHYIDFLTKSVNVSFNGKKVILDCANGAASFIAPVIFENLGATVIPIANTPNGVNINVNCGSTHPSFLKDAVLKEKADIGLAFDGDADRLIAIDHDGNEIDGDSILFALGKALKKTGELKNNTIVSTVMSNFGFKHVLAKSEIQNVQTQVGDRYVLEEMRERDYSLGGEQSGHIILLDFNTTGDGILSAVKLVSIMAQEKKSIKEIVSPYKKYPQQLLNINVKEKNNWDKNKNIIDSISHFEKQLNGNGRILVRASGTENLIRVMAEGESEEIVSTIVNGIADVIRKEIS